MTTNDRFHKQRVAGQLEEPAHEANALARKLGLDPFDVNYWIIDYDEMNELVAYGGFQRRYPHWRWGMSYDRQRKQRQFLGGKAFEIVNNDDPSNAFLQVSNDMADQKAVITHVEAHADFFKNNEWFRLFDTSPDAAAMLERHAETVEEYISDPDISREDIEAWIDHILCLEDNIDQHQPFAPAESEDGAETPAGDITETLESLDVSEAVRDQVFDEEWRESVAGDGDGATVPPEPERDVLGFLATHGKAYDEESGKAVGYEDWQQEVLELLRKEAHYFAPQKLTKVMNEGWAAYYESLMMADERFADADEFISYADHMAQVLGSPGLNPYKLGFELWQYVENRRNRREVIERLLRVDGVTWRNFDDTVDLDAVRDRLEPAPEVADPVSHLDALDPDDERVDTEALSAARDGDIDVESYPWKLLTYEGLAERHYSLVKPQHRGFLKAVTKQELEQVARYLFDTERYDAIEEAVDDVDRTAGWDRMHEVRESHNDVTFIDAFLTDEFVEANDYFTYEYTHTTEDFRATSTDAADVKKKLMLQFTNFGKPTIAVHDGNFRNRNELLLAHHYNGVQLDIEQAKQTLERVFELWGRPVALKTIVKELSDHDIEVARRQDREPEPTEQGKLIRFDGEDFEIEDLPDEEIEDITATDVDYDTKPDEWL
ncbi:SpoVR family protein [Natronomonas pharaonis DSM 2160]|uniref:SpoVR family protein n=1 Tax=Natronomonas pharaonis (strain ATCC 35678 / DSM 2160 / CIP 103997 / JCM 8858 / NBRC 14720 / NCIMB 2260 / Gabara) TaxID=348780 RepID=A0A1U7EXB7_NATPD|nr:SpoVR family protein [Natronomonas pharaonis]CAI49816.1 SpoVR family protein [Natronomonas pharaonis DSM 2160]